MAPYMAPVCSVNLLLERRSLCFFLGLLLLSALYHFQAMLYLAYQSNECLVKIKVVQKG